MKKLSFWVPTILCAIISWTAMVLVIDDNSYWKIVFLGFLPVCFGFLIDTFTKMNEEIIHLRERIDEIEKA